MRMLEGIRELSYMTETNEPQVEGDNSVLQWQRSSQTEASQIIELLHISRRRIGANDLVLNCM